MDQLELQEIMTRLENFKRLGWVRNRRLGNQGGIGNTLEDLLEIQENNLRTPDMGNWEIKSQRRRSNSLLTLFHNEPSPRQFGIVSRILLPKYGWAHKKAGVRYPATELSFRATLNACNYSDRGFKVEIIDEHRRIGIVFNHLAVSVVFYRMIFSTAVLTITMILISTFRKMQ